MNNPRDFWKFVNKNKTFSKFPVDLSFNGQTSSKLWICFLHAFHLFILILQLNWKIIPTIILILISHIMSISVQMMSYSLLTYNMFDLLVLMVYQVVFILSSFYNISYSLWILFKLFLEEIFSFMLKLSSITPV